MALRRAVKYDSYGGLVSQYTPAGVAAVHTIDRYNDTEGGDLIASSQFHYDGAARLKELDHTLGSSDIRSHAWQFDDAGRVAHYSNNVDDPLFGDVTYQYDPRDQLTAADRPGVNYDESFGYDSAGNRTANTSASGFAIGPDNRLLADAAYSYQYDDEGNRTRQTLLADNTYRTFTWDHRNRLTSVRNYAANNTLTQVVDYLYDAFDRRVGREVDDGDGLYDTLERYVWQGDQVVADFLDPDGPGPGGPAPFALAHRYLYGPAVDQLLAQEDLSQPYSSADRVLWPLSDNQHTTRDLVDNTGDPAGHFTYDAFGGLVAGDTSKTNVLYTARELDPLTGLQYNRARWYDAVGGVWLSSDPIGFQGGDYNLSRYGGNSPANATDPSGLEDASISAAPPWYQSLSNELYWRFVGRKALIADPRRDIYEKSAAFWIFGNFYHRTPLGGAIEGAASWIRFRVDPWAEGKAIVGDAAATAVAIPRLPEIWAGMDDLARHDAVLIPLQSMVGGIAVSSVPRSVQLPRSQFTGRFARVNPTEIRFSQTTAGGGGRAAQLRHSMSNGWNGPAIDAVETSQGLVTIDNTRIAIAQELGISEVPVKVRKFSDPIPSSMLGRFGNAKTWGEALQFRTRRQQPPLPASGTLDRPRLP